MSGGRADMRRLIHVFCAHVADDAKRPNFENELMEEAPEIIAVCKDIYRELCPNHGAIPCEEAREVALANEVHYLDIFHRYFVQVPGAVMRGEDVRELVRKSGLSNQEMKRMKDVWERELGVVIVPDKKGTQYQGMKLKANFYASTDEA